ncbi:unnamed protein product [Phaeothamnion confervicola]
MAGVWGAGGGAERLSGRSQALVNEVQIDGLAVLKIVKHCNEALPQMVAGSLLGLDQPGVLEVTHSFPFPTAKQSVEGAPAPDDIDGQEYQMEMMKMLREVNVDNNCVGWYQSMYLGSFCTQTLVDNQFSYQENLSDNSVVILYDPVQTANGSLTIKAYRLTKEFMRVYREKDNEAIRPSDILEELPIKIRNPGIINALVYDLQSAGKDRAACAAAYSTGGGGGGQSSAAAQDMNTDFDRLDLSTNPYLEKNLEYLCNWIDDLANEQYKFQQYTRNVQRHKQDQVRSAARRKLTNEERRAAGEDALPEEDASAADKKVEPPNRMETLLISNQIAAYCAQINRFAGGSFEKLFLAGSLQREST